MESFDFIKLQVGRRREWLIDVIFWYKMIEEAAQNLTCQVHDMWTESKDPELSEPAEEVEAEDAEENANEVQSRDWRWRRNHDLVRWSYLDGSGYMTIS